MNTRRKPPHPPHTPGETHGYEVSSIASVRESRNSILPKGRKYTNVKKMALIQTPMPESHRHPAPPLLASSAAYSPILFLHLLASADEEFTLSWNILRSCATFLRCAKAAATCCGLSGVWPSTHMGGSPYCIHTPTPASRVSRGPLRSGGDGVLQGDHRRGGRRTLTGNGMT